MTGAQLATSVLDLIGVLLLGLVGVLAAAAISRQPVPSQIAALLSRLGVDDAPHIGVAVTVAAFAAVLLLLKTALYGVLGRSIFQFLGRAHADVVSRTASRFSEMPVSFIEGRASQESAYAVYTGTQAAILGVLGAFSIVLAELTLLVAIGATLLVVDPVIAIISAVLMGAITALSHRWLARRMGNLGLLLSFITIDITRSVQEEVTAFRELIVLNRTRFVTRRISELATRGAGGMAQSQFMVQLPKLIYDVALVVGAAVITGWVVFTKSPEAAVGSLALFLAAGSRVVPSLLRVMNQSVSLSHSAGIARPAYQLIDDMQATPPRPGFATPSAERWSDPSANDKTPLDPRVIVEHVTFTYPDRAAPALEEVSLTIESGTHVAFVGGTGAGKSTLADIILGVQAPQHGTVTIGGVQPGDASTRWTGMLSYVPQNIALMDGTLRQNVALALPEDLIDDSMVWEVLELAHLATFVRAIPGGLSAPVGERGVKLSGGQRQRLGLARALYSKPALLVMDEATSALDAETEAFIAATIASLAGSVTRITVAHRLATVRSADQVVFLREGRVAAVGTFREVREQVPEFDRQASLLGLN